MNKEKYLTLIKSKMVMKKFKKFDFYNYYKKT